ncbi:glycoside hydrolase family 43 protein [Mucilaginibacter sp. Bleaf8]|uniref:glycoside hydrolase family 43 protein n=1 Tax=Mucilaginibacter sp. Bleaf8 TaxID=2834430 RepID=UPI001BCC605D|nr:glycoside hydrolase family 43 protein [Mucilaginibacter sp. Bleaf8]MBS7562955.1 glycoside hydrolase family 43 protein [Mucilaginibacter sp. Bleaf8]
MSFCVLAIWHPSQAQKKKIKTFTNPILPSGADPWITYKDGYYYYTNTLGDSLIIWKTKDIADLRNSPKKTIWIPPRGETYSSEIWAPEIHFLEGKWYMYFAADDGKNRNHRLYVLENPSPDPLLGQWSFKGMLSEASNKWAIDGSVFTHNGQLYLIWAGWEGDENGRQDIYIAKMKNPYTVEGKRVKISSPELPWERYGDLHDPNNPPHVDVNEGPEVLKHGDKLFLIYSASGCWTDFYALGMLTATASSDIMDPKSWKKSPQPVFAQNKENSVYAPGHNAFFKSPDGKEDWILYHANSKPGLGCGGERSPRMQMFTWKKDGTPNFGLPVKEGVPIPIPSESNLITAKPPKAPGNKKKPATKDIRNQTIILKNKKNK